MTASSSIAVIVCTWSFSLGATAVAAPPNEACADAEPIDLPTAIDGSTSDALHAQPATPCSTEDKYAVWYTFVAPDEDRYLFRVESDAMSDTTLALYASCDATTPLMCVDDLAHDLQPSIDTYLSADQVVKIRVAGWGGTRGDFRLVVDRFAELSRPVNDACADAIPITLDHPGAAATLNASGSDLSSCGPEDSVDVWYSFVAPASGDYDFKITQNLISAHYITLFDDCASAATALPGAPSTGELACGFAGTSAHLEAGQSVVVRAGTNPIVADWFNVTVGPPLPVIVPPNDNHQHPITVTVPSTTHASTWGGDREPFYWGPDCGPYVSAEIWYRFVAPDDDVYVFDTAGSEMTDTVVAVFAPCDEQGEVPPHLYACNDFDAVGDAGRLDGFLEAGDEVCIAVAGRYLSEFGGVTLNVSRLGPPPVNDNCEHALPIEVGDPIYGVNYASTPVDVLTQCPYGNFPLWYAFTAPADGLYKFDAKAGRDSWPDLAIYESCGPVASLACSSDDQPALPLTMTRGQTVRVRVSTTVWWRGTVPLRVGPVLGGEVVEEDPIVEEDPVVEETPELPPEAMPDIAPEPEPEPEPEPVVDTGSTEPDVVAADDPGAEAEDAVESDVTTGSDEGCGCGASPGADAGWSALVMLGLVLLRRRSLGRERA